MNDRVSVVIPAYRAERTIARAIDSARGQRVVDRIIVIEDGRFDATAKVVEKYPDVTLITLEHNQGAPHARNAGLARVETEYVVFMDSDDYLEGPVWEGLVVELERSGAAIGMAPQKNMYDTGETVEYQPPELDDPMDVAHRWLVGKSGPGVNSIMWRTAEVRRIGGWNEAMKKNQDGELVIRAMLNGLPVCYSREGYGVYCVHDMPSIRKISELAAYESYREFCDYLELAVPPGDVRRSRVQDGLQAFRAGRAINAFIEGSTDIGNLWAAEWRSRRPRTLPRVRGLRYRTVAALSRVIGLARAARLVGSMLRLRLG